MRHPANPIEAKPCPRSEPLPRRAFLLCGALAALGCNENKDTPETKAAVPPSVQAKESFDQYLKDRRKSAGRK